MVSSEIPEPAPHYANVYFLFLLNLTSDSRSLLLRDDQACSDNALLGRKVIHNVSPTVSRGF